MANLDRSENFCELVKLKEKGIVVDQESFISIFQTLAIGFQESDIMEDILEELTKVKTFIEFFFDNTKITKQCSAISTLLFNTKMIIK